MCGGCRSSALAAPVARAGLALAARLAQAAPGENVLLVVVETCTLAFRAQAPNKADIVASALFGDGAAACILRAGPGGNAMARVAASAEHIWPDTLDIMGWDIGDEGLGVIFAQSIPAFARAHLAAAFAGIFARWGMRNAGFADHVLHPRRRQGDRLRWRKRWDLQAGSCSVNAISCVISAI